MYRAFIISVALSSCLHGLTPMEMVELVENCAQLEAAWHDLYGPDSALDDYIASYRQGIALHAHYSQKSTRSSSDDAALLATNQLEANLCDIKNQVDAFLAAYGQQPAAANADVPLQPQGAAPSAAPTLQAIDQNAMLPAAKAPDASLQQLFLAIQELQQQSAFAKVNNEDSLLKQQLTLFTIGLVFLSIVTGYAVYKCSEHKRMLHSKTEKWQREINQGHDRKNLAGLFTRLTCAMKEGRGNA